MDKKSRKKLKSLTERQQIALVLELSSRTKSELGKELVQEDRKQRKCNARGETAVHIAAIKGDLQALEELVKEGTEDINARDYARWTPLHEASNRGWSDVVRFLLRHGGDPNAKGLDDVTPLHDAAVNGHAEVVKILMSGGADPLFETRDGRAVKDMAASSEIRELLDKQQKEVAPTPPTKEVAAPGVLHTKAKRNPLCNIQEPAVEGANTPNSSCRVSPFIKIQSPQQLNKSDAYTAGGFMTEADAGEEKENKFATPPCRSSANVLKPIHKHRARNSVQEFTPRASKTIKRLKKVKPKALRYMDEDGIDIELIGGCQSQTSGGAGQIALLSSEEKSFSDISAGDCVPGMDFAGPLGSFKASVSIHVGLIANEQVVEQHTAENTCSTIHQFSEAGGFEDAHIIVDMGAWTFDPFTSPSVVDSSSCIFPFEGLSKQANRRVLEHYEKQTCKVNDVQNTAVKRCATVPSCSETETTTYFDLPAGEIRELPCALTRQQHGTHSVVEGNKLGIITQTVNYDSLSRGEKKWECNPPKQKLFPHKLMQHQEIERSLDTGNIRRKSIDWMESLGVRADLNETVTENGNVTIPSSIKRHGGVSNSKNSPCVSPRNAVFSSLFNDLKQATKTLVSSTRHAHENTHSGHSLTCTQASPGIQNWRKLQVSSGENASGFSGNNSLQCIEVKCRVNPSDSGSSQSSSLYHFERDNKTSESFLSENGVCPGLEGKESRDTPVSTTVLTARPDGLGCERTPCNQALDTSQEPRLNNLKSLEKSENSSEKKCAVCRNEEVAENGVLSLVDHDYTTVSDSNKKTVDMDNTVRRKRKPIITRRNIGSSGINQIEPDSESGICQKVSGECFSEKNFTRLTIRLGPTDGEGGSMDSKNCSRNEPEQTSDSVSSSDSSTDPKFGGQQTSKRVNDDDVGIEEQKKRRRRNEEGGARGRAKGSEKGKVNRNTGIKQPPQLQPVMASSPAPSIPEQISGASTCSSFSPKCARSPEVEVEEKRTSDGECAPKVPPLKIVIPSAENETAVKSGKSRTAQQALPYIVSASSPCSEKEGAMSPGEDKKDGDSGDKSSPNGRVTRSSQKTGVSSSKSPSPAPTPEVGEGSEHGTPVKNEEPVKQEDNSQSVHPRKRKIKKPAEPEVATMEPVASVVQPNPPATEPQPFMNSVEEFLKIRKQVEQRRRNLVPVKIKPPQGFKDYLMNRCSYVLAGNASSRMAVATLATPQSLPTSMQELFTQQEKERYKLRMQHLVEKEKLVLSVEQEILRVHGRAARAAANQSLPYSACTILKDEEIYNPITPEQEAKESNARSRFTGRLLLSWLQDVDDKWEKIKEAMLLRHHNEAESLHAVQKMDWEWRLKELGLCEPKMRPVIDESSVPMVQAHWRVSDLRHLEYLGDPEKIVRLEALNEDTANI